MRGSGGFLLQNVVAVSQEAMWAVLHLSISLKDFLFLNSVDQYGQLETSGHDSQ